MRMSSPRCPTCSHAMVSYCPACRGKTGGAKRTPKQTEAARAVLEKNRAKRWPAKPDG